MHIILRFLALEEIEKIDFFYACNPLLKPFMELLKGWQIYIAVVAVKKISQIVGSSGLLFTVTKG